MEPGEIEAVLARHPEIRECAVFLHRPDRNEPGEEQLVAYFVSSESLSSLALRRLLRQELPDYMIPARFVMMDSLPRTATGKVDRVALTALATEIRRPRLEKRLPETPTERALAEIWNDELGADPAGIHDNFFDLGGHSLQSIRVIAKAERALGVRFRPRDLFLQNLGQLAASADERLRAAAEGDMERTLSWKELTPE